MNKVIIKESKKKFIVVDILMYLLYAFVGFILLSMAETGMGDPIEFIPIIFYIFAFISIFSYFVNRRKNEYEMLMLGFNNVMVGTFIIYYINYPNSGFIMADAVLIFSIANMLNYGCTCNRLAKEKDLNFFPKLSISLLLFFLGVFVVSVLYNQIEIGTLILGYYFVAFGLLNLLEPFISILINNKKLQKEILTKISPEEKKAVTKVKKTNKTEIKERKVKRIKKKVNIEKEK